MSPLKAVLIIIIVLGHFVYYMENPVFNLIHKLGTSAVAMFFFISGFGCIRSYQRKGREYLKGFFRSRILGILLPAAILLIIHSCWKHQISMPPQYWFLFVILFDYLLFWLCYSFLKPSLRIPALWIGSLLFIVVTILTGFDRCWWICCMAFPTGCFFSLVENTLAEVYSEKPLCFIAWMSAGLLLFALTFLTHNPYIWTLSYVGISWTLALIVSVIPLDHLELPVLSFLGSISYEIYLSHITIFEVLQRLLPDAAPRSFYILATLLLTIVVAYVVNRLCKMVIKK